MLSIVFPLRLQAVARHCWTVFFSQWIAVGIKQFSTIAANHFGAEMRLPCILIVDADHQTAERLRQSLTVGRVKLLPVSDRDAAMAVEESLSIILCATEITGGSGYSIASELCDRHPAAALFMLAESPDQYDAKKARDAGSIGAFFKPLTPMAILARIEEFLAVDTQPSFGDFPLPDSRDRIARLVRYNADEGELSSMEQLVTELLPLTVEKVLFAQLAENRWLKQSIERVIRETVEREVQKLLINHIQPPDR
jgi:DNA-binding response OmpR family regulator